MEKQHYRFLVAAEDQAAAGIRPDENPPGRGVEGS